MPKIRPGMKKPPVGFDAISAKLDEYEEQMHLAIQEESTGVVGQTSKKRNRDKVKNVTTRDIVKKSKTEIPVDDGDDNIDKLSKEEDTSTENNMNSNNDDNIDNDDAEATTKPIPPLWKIAQINAARTRYVFDAFFRHHHISHEVFDYCCEMHFIDAGLAKRWRLPGYEKLCCNACALPGAASLAAARNSKYAHRHSAERKSSSSCSSSNKNGSASSTCICRVPASQRKNKSFLACSVCGCTGCCSSDVAKSKEKEEK